MVLADDRSNAQRARAAAIVAALHILIGWALVTGLAVEIVRTAGTRLRVFDIANPPPPSESVPAPVRAAEPEGAAAPPSLESRPTPVVAPSRARSPVPTAPEPEPAPTGSAPRAGASGIPGPGSGAGGEGSGAGAGRGGGGTGGGGIARRAQRLAGGFSESDYRRVAGGRPLRGTVHVRYTVRTDGRVGRCSVTRSSGSGELDAETCRAIEQRFRYRPAVDSLGRPVEDVIFTNFTWEPRPPGRPRR